MKKSQSNFFNMILAVCNLFVSRQEVWKNKPVIEKLLNELNSLWQKIRMEATLQEQNRTKGYTEEKERLRLRLVTLLFRFAGRMKAFAEGTGNNVLATQMTFTHTQLKKSALNMLLIKAGVVVETARKLLPIPNEYEITEAIIDELEEALTVTSNISAQRDAMQGERSENTASLEMLFDELRKAVKRMDIQVEAFILDEEFVRIYFFTRRIRDVRGGGKSTPPTPPKEEI